MIWRVEFIPTAANEQARREFHQMRCCSLQIKDIDFHYKLNGLNDPSLKHVFVASLPKVMRTIKGIPLKLQVILCTFMEAQLQELEPKRCKLL